MGRVKSDCKPLSKTVSDKIKSEEDKICISQDPVLYCSNGSVAKDIRKKSIKYVCLPERRVAKLYEARIQRGESPQELKHQPVAFTAEMEQPVSCVRRL